MQAKKVGGSFSCVLFSFKFWNIEVLGLYVFIYMSAYVCVYIYLYIPTNKAVKQLNAKFDL